jgi:hypothetical protein
MRHSSFRMAVAIGAAFVAASGAAWPCGLEDPSSLSARRGFLNFAFPKSLYVYTAMWQAQLAGTLPRDDLAQRDDLTPEARATMQFLRANLLMRALAMRLGAAGDVPDRPAVSIVMVGPVLWSRLEPQGETVLAKVHVDGPETGDVVIVTDAPALRALVNGEMALAKALDLDLVRFYGDPAKVDGAQAWLAGVGRR